VASWVLSEVLAVGIKSSADLISLSFSKLASLLDFVLIILSAEVSEQLRQVLRLTVSNSPFVVFGIEFVYFLRIISYNSVSNKVIRLFIIS
jgi:hypothetical protein